MDVGSLFMIGFFSSAVCSGGVGYIVDTYGRKRACLLYCFLEVHYICVKYRKRKMKFSVIVQQICTTY
jgi:hypothetical protein